jgi:hypothetical protein
MDCERAVTWALGLRPAVRQLRRWLSLVQPARRAMLGRGRDEREEGVIPCRNVDLIWAEEREAWQPLRQRTEDCDRTNYSVTPNP